MNWKVTYQLTTEEERYDIMLNFFQRINQPGKSLAHYVGRRLVDARRPSNWRFVYSFLAYACTFYTIGVSVIMFTHGVPFAFGIFLAFINCSSVLFLFLKNPYSSQPQSQPHWVGA
jgi:hypothetical protein